jgi:two-component system, LytTR family, sensor kinase
MFNQLKLKIMKKSVRIALHAGFWALIPLTISFYNWAGQADSFFGLENHSKNFFQILFEGFKSLFIHPDVGSMIGSLYNLTMVFSNLVAYVIFPATIFYLFYGWFSPKIINNRSIRNIFIPILFILVVPFVIIKLLSLFTLVAWSFLYSLSLTYVITVFFAVSGFFFSIMENWILTEKLAKQNLQSELALLKNQINPHFLFNTLNNIDSLIKSNTKKASETLVKLSDILRYMIYDTNVANIQLTDEIRHIESYVELQKLQYANSDLVSLSVHGNPHNIPIAPMLFIPFVENAFKHCTDKSIPNAIRISFTVQDKQVLFESENISGKTQKINKDEASGVGLNIVRRRLEIIYPGRHKLNIKEENSIFNVTLSVDTHEN